MDALHFIKDMLSSHRDFLPEHDPVEVNSLNVIVYELINVQIFMTTKKFRVNPEDKKQALIEDLRLTARKVGNLVSEIFGHASRKQSSSSGSHDLDLVNGWKEILELVNGIIVSCKKLKQTKLVGQFMEKVNKGVLSYYEIEEVKEDLWNCITQHGENILELLLINAVPALGEHNEKYNMSNILLELFTELENLPKQICKACEEQPLAAILVGSLLSLKDRTYRTWEKVKDDLCKIQESDNPATNNHMCHIFAYCYDDLPYFLKRCFLYLACYPLGYEIPARSLTEMWIAEGFVKQEEGETMEETANKYLKQLIQRSLVWVSKSSDRSYSDTIKLCRIHRSIHEFVIQESRKNGFLVANPDKEKMVSLFRVAIHHNANNQYIEVKNNDYLRAFLAFDFDRDVLGSPLFLRVLELRKSAISNNLENMIYLRYLGLRGSTISEIPENIGNMQNLQTLDVRDTTIEILPESLWNILTLCNVYVPPGPKIEGPPPEAPIPKLQTLKTIVPSESWLKYNLDFPWQESNRHFRINLRKIALLIVKNQKWKCVSNLLNHMVNLHSMKILGNRNINIPSEYVDARAFPVLETVKLLKCKGKLNLRKLPIDNIKFPPNLIKLTLTKTGFEKDPMPLLEKLQSLKFLRLKNGAYTGEKMVCSENGFPQLQFIELSKLENLVIWEVKPMAMAQLTTMHVVQCPNLSDLPDLEHVTNIKTDIFTYAFESDFTCVN